MTEAEQEYFRTLTLPRQLEYLERSWGAMPSFSLDMVIHPKQGPTLVMAVKVMNPLLRAELGNIEPIVFTRKVRHTPDLDRLTTDGLIRWASAVREALR